jgi:hypothetical protein
MRIDFKEARQDGQSLLSGLFDLQFQTIVTTQMLPAIYGLAIALAGVASLYFVFWGFGHSWWMGTAWLLLFGPALFLAVIIAIRVTLEFVLTVFRIALFLETLGTQIDSIAAQTEEISDDLPRIQFWRSRRKARRGAGAHADEDGGE